MACCADGACPMHTSEPSGGSAPVVSQAEADSCCAASERDSSPPTAPTFALSIGLALVPSPVSLAVPAASVRLDGWRTLVPMPGAPVPKHLLLSVFLI